MGGVWRPRAAGCGSLEGKPWGGQQLGTRRRAETWRPRGRGWDSAVAAFPPLPGPVLEHSSCPGRWRGTGVPWDSPGPEGVRSFAFKGRKEVLQDYQPEEPER